MTVDVGELVTSWRVTRLHHVAFAHRGEDTPRRLAALLGLPCVAEEHAEGFVERMLPAGDSYMQLLEATGPGVVGRFLQSRGQALHHIALEVSDLDAAIADLLGRGVRMIDQRPRPGALGTTIAFIHPAASDGLLLELVGPPAAGVPVDEDQIAGRS
jgi:methylmalonyl-CoA/ethylmalonyl-CoA epimerase